MVKFDASKMDLPPEINAQAWVAWCEDRKERKKPLTTRGAILVMNKLLPFSHYEQAEAVKIAIDCGWASVFPKHQRGFIEQHTDTSWAPQE